MMWDAVTVDTLGVREGCRGSNVDGHDIVGVDGNRLYILLYIGK